MARLDAGLDTADLPPEQLKVSIGTSMNGQVDLGESTFAAFLQGKDVLPWTTNEYPAHAATSHIAIDAGAHGQTTTFSTACAAGLGAIRGGAGGVRRGQTTGPRGR